MCIPRSCWKTSDVFVVGDTYGSQLSRSNRSANVTAFWCGIDGIIQPYSSMYLSPRPGKVKFYLKHTVNIEHRYYDHILACLEWFLPLPDELHNYYGKPVEVWRSDLFEFSGAAMFLPVQRIKSKFVCIETNFQNRNVIVVMPRCWYLDV